MAITIVNTFSRIVIVFPHVETHGSASPNEERFITPLKLRTKKFALSRFSDFIWSVIDGIAETFFNSGKWVVKKSTGFKTIRIFDDFFFNDHALDMCQWIFKHYIWRGPLKIVWENVSAPGDFIWNRLSVVLWADDLVSGMSHPFPSLMVSHCYTISFVFIVRIWAFSLKWHFMPVLRLADILNICIVRFNLNLNKNLTAGTWLMN